MDLTARFSRLGSRKPENGAIIRENALQEALEDNAGEQDLTNAFPGTPSSGKMQELPKKTRFEVPDFAQQRLVEDDDFAVALSDTIPKSDLNAEELLEGCSVLNSARERFEKNVEARNMLMTIAYARWINRFEAVEGYKSYDCKNMFVFVKAGHLHGRDGRTLLYRSFTDYRRTEKLFDVLYSRILEHPGWRQASLIRRVLEIGPSKLNICGRMLAVGGKGFDEDEWTNLVLHLEPETLPTFEGESVDPWAWGASKLSAFIEAITPEESATTQISGKWAKLFGQLGKLIDEAQNDEQLTLVEQQLRAVLGEIERKKSLPD
jgi:hypothetical protein